MIVLINMLLIGVVKDVVLVRKCRRRVFVGGVVDDCFICVKWNVKCDWRRLYCL